MRRGAAGLAIAPRALTSYGRPADKSGMSDGGRILGIVMASLALAALIFAGLGALWWKNQGSAWFADGKQAYREGTELGPDVDNSVCLDCSLERVDACRGLGCEIGTVVFLNACLAQARPAPEFCEGVPAQSEIFDSVTWRLDRCEAIGREGDSCENLFASVQGYCEGLRSRGRLPADAGRLNTLSRNAPQGQGPTQRPDHSWVKFIV